FDQAIRLGLDDPVAFQNRGQARQALGDLDGALADMNEAIRLQPRSPFGFMGRGLLRRAKDQLELAVADYTESLKLMTSGTAVVPTLPPPGSVLIRSYDSRALAYEAMGDIGRAKEDFAAALGVNAVDQGSKALQASAKARLAVLAPGDGQPAPGPTALP